ncbi:MAG: excinuclease ABC subunit UvrB [Eubacterium sp.]|nr:excinuclease ABC subunit UvrB [Eubacterium sp.]
MAEFKLNSEYAPTGDQPQAIKDIVDGFNSGKKRQTLLGVTGSGKTFTMANVIKALGKKTLIMSHNKTLAAQLYGEMKSFFPENAVEYFVSYYDYYQPEAYVPSSDTYIAKDSSVNDEIDMLRHSATSALIERDDVIVVSSVSCIYGIGNPEDYKSMMLGLRPGMALDRDVLIRELVDMQYTRNEMDFKRSSFRVKGDVVDIIPANKDGEAVRIEFFGDEIDRLSEFDPLTGVIKRDITFTCIFPASYYVIAPSKMEKALQEIDDELRERIAYFKSRDKLLEAQRIQERTEFDMEMLRETGFCSGIENYTRILAGGKPGEAPDTLIDFFGDDYLLIIDESHQTIPQVRGMFGGNKKRKETLIEFGFRLPSAMDNRPLNFEEYEDRLDKVLFVSATPGPYEVEHEEARAEQIIRPTGLLDPPIEVRPVAGQVDDLYKEINNEINKGNKVLVTTLTKRMAEELTEYLRGLNVKVKYLHSDIDTLERMEIVRDLRLGVFDVLVGINLLREGLDIPEITLVAILDADKEGFLRSETSLIQTIGRAARNVDGHVIMYADTMTDSMRKSIDETNRRRELQQKYNEDHGITPQTIRKAVRELISTSLKAAQEDAKDKRNKVGKDPDLMNKKELGKEIDRLTKKMNQAAAELNFELAAILRDELIELKVKLRDYDK